MKIGEFEVDDKEMKEVYQAIKEGTKKGFFYPNDDLAAFGATVISFLSPQQGIQPEEMLAKIYNVVLFSDRTDYAHFVSALPLVQRFDPPEKLFQEYVKSIRKEI